LVDAEIKRREIRMGQQAFVNRIYRIAARRGGVIPTLLDAVTGARDLGPDTTEAELERFFESRGLLGRG
jgi:hypothetical protein